MKTTFLLNIDQDLLDKVRDQAEQQERSVTAQICYLLKKGLITIPPN
jgi:hypothetical protein